MIKKIKNIKPTTLLIIVFSLLLIVVAYASYKITASFTVKDCYNQEECEKCEECSNGANNENDNYLSKELGIFNANNSFDVAKTYINLIIPISDITGKISDISSLAKEIIFANYLYSFKDNRVELTAAEMEKMEIPYLKEITVKFDCIKISIEKFDEYFKHIFGVANIKYISTYLPNWKKVDNYYYYDYDLLAGANGPQIASYNGIKFNDNNVEIIYRYAKDRGDAYCFGKYYTEEELEELDWRNESEGVHFLDICGAYKKLILNKNSDGSYYAYRIENVD